MGNGGSAPRDAPGSRSDRRRGSLANLVAVITPRRERLPPDFLRGTLYASEEARREAGGG